MNSCFGSFREKVGFHLNTRLGVIIELLIFVWVMTFSIILSLPSTIIPYFILACLSLWFRRKKWSSLGLTRPHSWLTVIVIGVGIGGIIVTCTKLGLPILFDRLGEEYQPTGLYTLEGDLPQYLTLLVGTWILAALMEEMVYRGYILNRLIDLLGKSSRVTGIALVFSTVLFAFAHGVLEPQFLTLTFLHGLLLGILYLSVQKNLWYSIIAHGTGITATITLAYFGVF